MKKLKVIKGWRWNRLLVEDDGYFLVELFYRMHPLRERGIYLKVCPVDMVNLDTFAFTYQPGMGISRLVAPLNAFSEVKFRYLWNLHVGGIFSDDVHELFQEVRNE